MGKSRKWVLEDKIQEAVHRRRNGQETTVLLQKSTAARPIRSPNRRRTFSLVRPPLEDIFARSGDEGPRTSSFRTNQRHPCVHWWTRRGRPATRPEQPSRKLLQRKKNKNDSSPVESGDWKSSCSKSGLRHRVPDVQAEVARMQGIIDRLQQELDDKGMVAGLPHKKSRVGPSTPQGVNGGRAPTPLAITGGHASACQ